MHPLLKIQNLSYQYPTAPKKALDDLSFEIKSGDFIGLLGPNGAGKTTLLSILASLIDPLKGQLVLSEPHPKSWIALAPQEIALYPSLTAFENLKFFAEIGRVESRRVNEKVKECLEFVGLYAQRDMKSGKFSGGMKRRLNIAVALVTSPKLLMLDEPTVGVDPHSRHLILQALNELNSRGTTLLYSSHYMEEVEKFCRTLLLLDHGKILFQGSMNEFKNSKQKQMSLEEHFIEWTGKDLRDV